MDTIALWKALQQTLRQTQPGRKLPRVKADGWISPIHSPLRVDKNPSFGVCPPKHADDPGAWKDWATHEHGSLVDLAKRLGTVFKSNDPLENDLKRSRKPAKKAAQHSDQSRNELEKSADVQMASVEQVVETTQITSKGADGASSQFQVGSTPSNHLKDAETWTPDPEDEKSNGHTHWTFDAWCASRGLDRKQLEEVWDCEVLRHRKRGEYFRFPTPSGRYRLRFCDGEQPKTSWEHGGAKNGTKPVYGIDHLRGSGPVYLVNGEPGVWACYAAGVDAVCLCAAEGTVHEDQAKQLAKLERPIRIVFDFDQAGKQGAAKAISALKSAGVQDVKSLQLPDRLGEKGDVEDLWRDVGGDRLAGELELLPIIRPVVWVDTDAARTLNEALEALTLKATELGVYQRGGRLVRVSAAGPTPPGVVRAVQAPQIQGMPYASLRVALSAAADWYVGGKKSLPPQWLVQAVGNCSELTLPPLTGVAESPVVRADGSILSRPGYDEQTGLYLASDLEVDVPDQPTREDVLRAIELLTTVLVDFPLPSPAHHSAWMAALLTPLARWAYDGPAPMIAVDANVRGVGKTLLADLIGLIITGRVLPKSGLPDTDDELRKKISTILLDGDQMHLWDNVDKSLGSRHFDALLTSTSWSDRQMATLEGLKVEARCCWMCTGNNLSFSGDLARRVLHVRLESNLEDPESRKDFAIGDVRVWVHAHRAELVAAGLTLLSGYLKSGEQADFHPWGSFEAWSALVRGALVWAGMPDPIETRPDENSGVDAYLDLLRVAVEFWPPDLVGGFEELTSSQIAQRLGQVDDKTVWKHSMEELCSIKGRISTGGVGYQLRRWRGRVVGTRRLVRKLDRNKVAVWTVEKVAP